MIKLTRIDDRLVHGQVAFTWVSSLGIDCLVVANDKIAKDEFQKMAMGLAKPPMVKLAIMTLADSIVFLNYLKNKNSKNEKVLSFELGYGFRSQLLNANINRSILGGSGPEKVPGLFRKP